jgi:hypothetical protein
MKRQFSAFIIVLLLISTEGLAQEPTPISKGSLTLSGEAYFRQVKQWDEPVRELIIQAGALYFLHEHFAAGGTLRFTHFNLGTNNYSFIPGVSLRYYWKYLLYMEAYYQLELRPGIRGGLAVFEWDGYGGEVGKDIFLNEHIALEPYIRYSLVEFDPEDIALEKTFQFGLRLAIFLHAKE